MKGMGELRRRKGLTQAALAEKVGVGVNTIARYERGEMEPSLKIAHVIAEVLGCTESELLNGPAKQELDVKILMGVKSLTGLAGVEVADNSFIYGIQDDEPQIVLLGKVRVDTPEERMKALAKIIRKFDEACQMYDKKTEDNISAEDVIRKALERISKYGG